MSATSNSGPGQPQPDPPAEPALCRVGRRLIPRGPAALVFLGVVVLAIACLCVARATAESETAARARLLAARAYADAQALHRASPTNAEAARQFGRASYDWAEFATNDSQRADIAGQGIAACRQSVAREPASAPGHYYLAMNLGQLARTKSLGALKIVGELEREFKTAHDLDEQFNRAGPDRCLGLLYLGAPGWPASIGSRTKARRHLQRAVQLAPGYPENRLNLFEACLKWGDGPGARRELAALDTLWPAAQANFAGDVWAASWADWEARLKKARGKIAEAVKPSKSPRSKS